MHSRLLAPGAAALALWLSACNCNVIPPGTDGGAGGIGGGGASVGGGQGGGGAAGGGTGGGMVSCTTDQSCYPFDAGAPGAGACLGGTEQCVMGTLGPCIGAVGPSLESCNGLDDDCNGASDDGLGQLTCGIGICQRSAPACANGLPGTCMPGPATAEICTNMLDDDCDGVINNGCNCIYVAPSGSDMNTGASASPVRHLAVAQDIAGDAGVRGICVASGNSCPSTFDYGGSLADGGEQLVMRDGISVFGSYQRNTAGGVWPRVATCVTRITAVNAEGVLFDRSVTSPTAIDGFELQGGAFATAAAVTVRGSTGAVINDDNVLGGAGAGVTTSIGIDVMNAANVPATPTISRSSVSGAVVGGGTAIGVRSVSSAPNIVANCPAAMFDPQGRCQPLGCGGNGGLADSIKGATGAGIAVMPLTAAYGVLLDNSPNAQIDSSAVCSVPFQNIAHSEGAGVKIQGGAAGIVIRRSNILGWNGSKSSVGVWADPCRGAAPWLFDNYQITGTSNQAGSRSDGVRAIGACDVRVDSNRLVTGGVEAAGQDTNGVYCAQDPATGLASQCTVLANTAIQGSNGGFPPRSVGVRCDDGACARIEGNGVITGRGGVFAAGVIVSRAGPFIARNIISGGCGTQAAIGLQSIDAFARVENNAIHGLAVTTGGACAVTNATQSSAVAVINAAGNNELDLHSNTLFADGLGTCTGRALSFGASDAGMPTGPRGLVRNNVLMGGTCATRFDLEELAASADPRVLQNNFFEQGAAGPVEYRDEAATNLPNVAAVNALADITSSGNIEGIPGLGGGGGFHLTATSVCRNAGTDAGVPAGDYDKDRRPQEGVHDIGADEFVP